MFHDRLRKHIHNYALYTYEISKTYPSEGKYGLVSQDRRAAVSVMLNYVEGYARMSGGLMRHFLQMSFASLKESIYIKYLSYELDYITEEQYKKAFRLKEEIAPLLYKTIKLIR